MERKYSNEELLNQFYLMKSGIPFGNTELKSIVTQKGQKKIDELYLKSANYFVEKYPKIPSIFFIFFFSDSFLEGAFSIQEDTENKRNYISFNISTFFRIELAYLCKYFVEKGIMDKQEFKDFNNYLVPDEIKKFTRSKLKELRKIINNIDDKELCDYLDNLSPSLKNFINDKLNLNNPEELKSFISIPIVDTARKVLNQLITDLLMDNKYVYEDLLKEVKDISFMDYIDEEKFLLLLNSKMLDLCKKDYDDQTMIYSVINYYYSRMNDESVNKLKILKLNKDNILEEYSFKDFCVKLQDYIKEHKEVNMTELGLDFFRGWNSDEITEFLDAFSKETLENFEVINPDAIYIPYGDYEKKSEKEHSPSVKSVSNSKSISLLTLRKRKFYADNRPKIYTSLMGKNKFSGYIANIFLNGYVIFEKYDNKDQDISTASGAAYYMPITCFNTFCQKTISEIRDFVKLYPSTKINFRTHRGDWEKDLQKIIDGETTFSIEDIQKELEKHGNKIKKLENK